MITFRISNTLNTRSFRSISHTHTAPNGPTIQLYSESISSEEIVQREEKENRIRCNKGIYQAAIVNEENDK